MDLNVVSPEEAQANLEAVKADKSAHALIANPSVSTPSGKSPQVSYDDTYSKLLKIVPAPVAGAYTASVAIVIAATNVGAGVRHLLLWGLFVFFLAATVAYLVMRGIKHQLQIAMSAIAFIAIATATPGPFTQIKGWSTAFGSVAVIVVGAIIVIVDPSALKPSKKR